VPGSILTGANTTLAKTITNEGKNLVDKANEDNGTFDFEALLRRQNLPLHEHSVVESLKTWYNGHGYLSPRQTELFKKIEQEYTSEAVQARNTWVSTYGEREREIATICAHYYAATLGEGAPYFTELAQRVLSEPHFVPSEKQWRAMCSNKYAQRVLEATRAPPKYPVGTLVQFRANERPLNVITGDAVNGGIVLDTDVSPVTRAAKGTKKYSILLMGGKAPLIIEERRLKVLKRRKN
jgi:hypothetical protein